MTGCEHYVCSAERTGEGYWTCDVPGGCTGCRKIAASAGDRDQLAEWAAELAELNQEGHIP